MMIETPMEILVPSWWEIEVTVAALLCVIASYWFFFSKTGDFGVDRSQLVESSSISTIDDKDKVKEILFFHLFFLFTFNLFDAAEF